MAQFETYSYDPATGSSENFEPFFGPEFHELYGIRSRTPPSGWSDTETSYEKYDPATGTWEEVWKFRQNEYQSVWLPNWKRAVFKRNSDGAVFVRNLDTGVQTRSPFDNALQTWPNVSFGTNVIAGKFVTFGEIGGGRWAV